MGFLRLSEKESSIKGSGRSFVEREGMFPSVRAPVMTMPSNKFVLATTSAGSCCVVAVADMVVGAAVRTLLRSSELLGLA